MLIERVSNGAMPDVCLLDFSVVTLLCYCCESEGENDVECT